MKFREGEGHGTLRLQGQKASWEPREARHLASSSPIPRALCLALIYPSPFPYLIPGFLFH